MAKKTNPIVDNSTEEKIKQAARIVFHKKGYAAARTRDIAEEAGINLALLNYYFRSKEKLFEIVMLETMQGFTESLLLIFNNEQTSLEEKVKVVITTYIDLLKAEPEIPLFIMSEIRSDPNSFAERIKMKDRLLSSYFIKQFQEAVIEGRVIIMHPIHFIVNVMGLVLFPFIAGPLIKAVTSFDDDGYAALMEERKTLIPMWINTMLKPA